MNAAVLRNVSWKQTAAGLCSYTRRSRGGVTCGALSGINVSHCILCECDIIRGCQVTGRGGTESESGDHYLDRGELTPVTGRLVHPDQAGISDMESHGVTWR